MTIKSLQTIAAEWHNGQNSALYAYASTGTIIQPELALEINECLTTAKPRERTDLYRLYVNTAPGLSMADVEANCEFWHRIARNANGSPMRCRKSGQLKTWKTRLGDFRQQVKYGLKTSFYITPININEWCLPL